MKRTIMKVTVLMFALLFTVTGIVYSTMAASDKKVPSTSIHVHIEGDKSSVNSVRVTVGGITLSLSTASANSGLWTVSDNKEYVSDSITAVYVNGVSVPFTSKPEGNGGTINLFAAYTAPIPTNSPTPTPTNSPVVTTTAPSTTDGIPLGEPTDEIPLGTPNTGDAEIIALIAVLMLAAAALCAVAARRTRG